MRSLEQVRDALRGASVTEVARRTGVHRSTIYRIIAGQGTTYETLRRISDWLDSDDAKGAGVRE